jgi:uncharacterized RDD family membrane protein YckC
MQCPRCGLLNPPEALRCDCEWDFATKTLKTSYLHPVGLPELAGLDDRFVGQVLDGGVALIALVVGVILSSVFGSAGAVMLPLGAVAALSYMLFADGLEGGQSYGKRAVHTAVIDARTGAPCTFGKSLARNLPLAIFGVIDSAFILGERRQRLGDRLAGTIVIKTAEAQASEPAGPPLSDDEVGRTRQLYAGLSTGRLEELLASPADLRPGAAELLEEELGRRDDDA